MKLHNIINPSSRLPLGILAILCLFVFYIYSQASDGPLILDDYPNIVHNQALRISDLTGENIYKAAVSMGTRSNGEVFLNRPISFVSFGLNFYESENVYRSIKLTNIVLHILCGLFIYQLLVQILKRVVWQNSHDETSLRQWIPLLVTSLWLLHPIMVSTVLYSVQRMTILSALFSLCALNCFCHYREQLINSSKGIAAGVVSVTSFTILAYLSKENGALTLVFCAL